jgi:hypothetical protein
MEFWTTEVPPNDQVSEVTRNVFVFKTITHVLVLGLVYFCLEDIMSIFEECFLKQLQLRMTGRRRDCDRDRRHLNFTISAFPASFLRVCQASFLCSPSPEARRGSAEMVKSGPARNHGR